LTIWDEILNNVRTRLPDEDFRRSFGSTAYASDSGDQITVWVPTEAIRRQIVNHHTDVVQRAVETIGRPYTTVRFVVGGTDEDEDEDDETL
jgi:hypothetical protein